MKTLFFETIYRPLYNLLVGLIDILPHADIGFAVIILTIIVKIILFPLSKKSIQTQILMKEIEGPLKEIREKYKDNPQEQAQKTLQMYRDNNINPFAGIFLILIQLPIIITLYFVFAQSGLPVINPELLYSFVAVPETIRTTFLGFIDLVSNKSLLVALLVLITQAIQIRFSLPKAEDMPTSDNEMAQEFMKGLHFQMKYVLPIITAVASYSFISVVGLYWIVGNIFATFQEIHFRRTIKRKTS
jgi:YidC/Oxa1 family membrane protein insertase